jgi:hypothetical protein
MTALSVTYATLHVSHASEVRSVGLAIRFNAIMEG